jgi:drug/metabolite transporter (DMT)-like permease
MVHLLLAALIWGLAYGINRRVMAFATPPAVGLLCCGTGLALFLPFARHRPARNLRISFAAIGFFQFGLMNYFYQSAFSRLEGHLVALLSLTVPVYVGLFADISEGHKPWRRLLFAAISIALCAYALGGTLTGHYSLLGLLDCQLANLFYGLGQVLFGRLMRSHGEIPERAAFFWMWLGATVPLLLALLMAPAAALPEKFCWAPDQLAALLFVGIFCGAIGNYLWNKGIVAISSDALLICNNLPMILGLLFGRLLFDEGGSWSRQIAALTILLALLYFDRKIEQRRSRNSDSKCRAPRGS